MKKSIINKIAEKEKLLKKRKIQEVWIFPCIGFLKTWEAQQDFLEKADSRVRVFG